MINGILGCGGFYLEIMMSKKKEVKVKCGICGLAIEKNSLMVRNKKSYHSKYIDDLMVKERKSRRNAIKIMGLGTVMATASFLGAEKVASAADIIPGNRGGTSPRSFVLPQLFFDPGTPLPGEMWYRMDKGVTVYHDGIINRNIHSNRNSYFITVSANGMETVFPRFPMTVQTSGPTRC